VLYFSYQRLGKFTNITDLDVQRYTNDELYPGNKFDKEIWISRKHGDTISITFQFGKNEDGHWEYIDYEITQF
jgi:hypothetical protein